MTTVVLFQAITTVFVKPYRDEITNKVAILSFSANLCIAFINMFRATLVSLVYEPNFLIESVLNILQQCNSILLIWLPITAVGIWIICVSWKKLPEKFRCKKSTPKSLY